MDEIQRQHEAVERGFEELNARIEALRERPWLDGEAVEAVREEELVAIQVELARLTSQGRVLNDRIANRPGWDGCADDVCTPPGRLQSWATRYQWVLAGSVGVLTP